MQTRTQPVTYLVLHHYGGWPPASQAAFLAQSIADGFSDIPYTDAFAANGTRFPGRDEKWVGAANLGLNQQSLALCLFGNFDEGDNPGGRSGLPMLPTGEQLQAAGEWVAAKLAKHPGAKFIMHKDVHKLVPQCMQAGKMVSTATACPGSRFEDGHYARIIWLIACGKSLPAAYDQVAREHGQGLNKHAAFVSTLTVTPDEGPHDEPTLHLLAEPAATAVFPAAVPEVVAALPPAEVPTDLAPAVDLPVYPDLVPMTTPPTDPLSVPPVTDPQA